MYRLPGPVPTPELSPVPVDMEAVGSLVVTGADRPDGDVGLEAEPIASWGCRVVYEECCGL